ncbi:hypothetical protein Tco_0033434 [Tanacetum coccineum]
MEAEFPAIVIDDAFTPQDALSCKSQVSTHVNDEIDFRISFDESDDEDYIIICDKNSFSYKMIYINNLKTDSENDNENAGIPSFPLSKPTTSYVNDLDFFKDFENEFPAIVYNDAQTSKSDLLTYPILSPQHIDEFNLNDETSVSEYDEEEQNILYFNDLFPFNIIRIDDLKSKKDNNDNDIDIIQSSEDMAPLPPREQRHPFLRYQGLKYTDEDIADFEERWSQETIKLDAVYSGLGITYLGGDGVPMVLLGTGIFLRPPPSYTLIRDLVLRLCHRMMAHSIVERSQAPEKVTVTDLFYLRGLDVRSVNISYLLARYLRRFAAGRKSGDHISGGQFVARLAEHFGLLTAEILVGLIVITLELSIIDMGELVRLQICMEAPQQPPPPPPVAARTMPQRLGRLEEEVQGLRRDVRSLRGLVERLMTDQARFSTWMMSCMAQLMDASWLTYQAFDGTFRGSSPGAFQRRSKQRTGEANTSAAQQDPQIKPGSKFSTIVHEYDTEPSRIFTLNARMGKRDDFKCVEAEHKSNLKTLL